MPALVANVIVKLLIIDIATNKKKKNSRKNSKKSKKSMKKPAKKAKKKK